MRSNPQVLARALIRSGGRVLLARSRGSRNARLPGGHVEPGEPVERALERELAEELGLKRAARRYLGTIRHFRERDGRRLPAVDHVFEVSDASLSWASAPPSLEPHLEFVWALQGALERENLKPRVLIALIRGEWPPRRPRTI